MRSTGEKKCTPYEARRRFDNLASEVIGSVEVLEPKTTWSPITASVRAIASALTLRSSNTPR